MPSLILVLTLLFPIYGQAQYVRDVSEICGIGKKSKRLKVLCQRWRRHDRNYTGSFTGRDHRNGCDMGICVGVGVAAKRH